MRGVAVAPQPQAAEVGAAVMRSGGNAFDAAVAAAFVQAATDPFMCGIGGIGIAQIFDAATGEQVIIDFVGRVGSRAEPDRWAKRARRTPEGKTYVEGWGNYLGYQAILIPGTVAGLAAIHAGRGRLPWRELLQPAIRILREGIPVMTETRLPQATARALEERGHRLKPRPFAYDSLQGRIQLIVAEAGGWTGASDPRRDGGAAMYT